MDKPLFNKHTEKAIDQYLANPSHALCLIGPPGAGKHFTALQVASKVLDEHDSGAIYSVGTENDLGIEAVRKLQKFLQLKKPGKALLRRAAIIENAERMSIEAQNALLKTLEEPPQDAIFIITSTNLAELRPTIRSRCQVIVIKPLDKKEALSQFTDTNGIFDKAFALSGGYAGLMSALLDDKDHELITAVNTAKDILKSSAFERLTMIDPLIKAKTDLNQLFYALQRVLGAVMAQSKPDKLQKLIKASRALYEAEQDYKQSANAKLLLGDLFLQL